MMQNQLPPGAQVVEPPPVQHIREPSKLRRLLMGTRSLVGKALVPFGIVASPIATVVCKAGGLVWDATCALNRRVIQPSLDFLEAWVPGMAHLRLTLLLYALAIPVVTVMMVSLAGGSFLLCLFMAVAVPFVILVTPSILIDFLLHVWLVSSLLSLWEGIWDACTAKDGRYFLTHLWPGMAHVAFKAQTA